MSISNIIQPTMAAGFFYPKHAAKITALLDQYFENAAKSQTIKSINKQPFAIIVPNTSYKDSGSITATAYQALTKFRDKYKRIVILGSGSKIYFRGMAYYYADYYATPLGEHKMEQNLRHELLLKQLIMNVEPAFDNEYTTEVQLPYLSRIFGFDTPILPLLFGKHTKFELITKVINESDDGSTLFIISTDINDFGENTEGTISKFISKNYKELENENKSAIGPVKGLLKYIEDKSLTVEDVAFGKEGSSEINKNHASFVIY